jgi:hypothetical protein
MKMWSLSPEKEALHRKSGPGKGELATGSADSVIMKVGADSRLSKI